MKIKIDEEEKHRIAVAVLTEWYEMLAECTSGWDEEKAALEVVLQYGMSHEEYKQWSTC